MRKYNPSYIKSRDWNEIRDFYKELKISPMVDLVNHIMTNGLTKRLYATTSLYFLLISVYEEIELNREILKIEFSREENKWFFRYYSKPLQEAEFEREYDKDLGIEKFDQFIDFIKW